MMANNQIAREDSFDPITRSVSSIEAPLHSNDDESTDEQQLISMVSSMTQLPGSPYEPVSP